jgi:ATP adenylyltransferase
VTLDRLWAGWRGEYVASVASHGDDGDATGCVFCRILGSGEPDDATLVVWRGDRCVALLNLFPYTSGHLMLLPVRHVGELEDLTAEESAEVWAAMADGVRALKAAYRPDGINVGINLGRAAGAGIPGHFHVHCLPRWAADSNFMTAVAEARVLPEALPATYDKVRSAWPGAAAP